MKFEIPLTETQRYILQITTGFTGLPHTFSQKDLEENKDRSRELPASETPSWKSVHQERRKELDKQNETILSKIQTFYAQRMNLYNECALGKSRGEAAIAFKDALSAEDRRENERLFAENSRIFDEQEKISHKEAAIYRRNSFKLLGIIGIAQCLDDAPDYPGLECYNKRMIPWENYDAAQRAVTSGIFSKEITPQDRDVLKYLYGQAGIHGDLYPKKRHPMTFSVVPVTFALNLSDVSSTQESFYRLTGLLCHLYLPKDVEQSYLRGTIIEYCDHWFIPRVRRPLVKEVLGR